MLNQTIRSVRSLALAVAFVVVGRAEAFHDEPKRAKAIKTPLVTAYEPCTNPNTQTLGTPPLPACVPAQRMDTVCGFTSGTFLAGHGKASGRSKPNGDFQVNVVAKGLNAGCEGRTLCGTIRVRATTHRCADGPCTVQDMDFTGASPTACCIVSSGTCVVQTTINSEVLGTLVPGDRTGVEVFGIGLRRVNGPDLPSRYTFTSGGLTP